jgi:UDPglucose--hexose-1-phosphate uridylyltransferase
MTATAWTHIPAASTMPRHTLRHPDGRCLYVYGPLRGGLRADETPTPPPTALHQRCDLLTGGWVAISPSRNARPQTGADVPTTPASDRSPSCPLCPCGPEVPFSYDAAVFENRFPSLSPHPPPPPRNQDLAVPSFGRCEVVLYTESHVGSLATLTPLQVARVVAVWRDRSRDLWAQRRHRHVLIFENRGEEVGATLSHPHGQIYAFDRLPPLTARRVSTLVEHRDRAGRCLSCEIVARDDRAAERAVAHNDSFAVAVPYAARWPYEVHVRARRHGLRRLGDLTPSERLDLAAALQEVVIRYDGLFGTDLPYMMVAQEAPAGDDGQPQADWHLSFEFLPPHRSATKLKVRASVETSTGLFINDTLPEMSAAALADVAVPPRSWDGITVPDTQPA